MLLVTTKKCKQTADYFTKKQSFKKVFSHRHNRGKRKYYIQFYQKTATPISMILNFKKNREAEMFKIQPAI